MYRLQQWKYPPWSLKKNMFNWSIFYFDTCHQSFTDVKIGGNNKIIIVQFKFRLTYKIQENVGWYVQDNDVFWFGFRRGLYSHEELRRDVLV